MTSDANLEKTIPHRVIPDGCVDIIFDLNGHSYGDAGAIVGTMTKPIFAELQGRVNYIAIRFLPGGSLHFLDNPMCDFTDQIVPLEPMSGKEEHSLTEQLVTQSHIEDRINIFESYLGGLLRRNSRSDLVVRSALCHILRNSGNMKVSELSKITTISARQLRRKFEQWIGVSPKVFCRIIRFQSFLQSVRHGPKCDLLSVALDCGYYDQSHFIHDFNSYYGLTPSEFLRIENF